jgi:mannose-6-phosphate isomerase-like protein (cupin superfamily)
MKRIEKPWGFEEIITLNDRYCFKRLFLKAGHKTSLQYHASKHETMYFLSGKAWLEIHSGEGAVDRRVVGSGDFAEVRPLTVHRVFAEEDTYYVEASTPEIQDVVRLQDDYQRI